MIVQSIKVLLIVLVGCFSSTGVVAVVSEITREPLKSVRIPIREENVRKIDWYFIHLLEMSLQKGQPEQKIRIVYDTGVPSNLDRTIAKVKTVGTLDVLWTGSSHKLENQLRAIPIPLQNGLMGQRVFLIRKGEQHLFDSVNTVEKLKAFKAGQAESWPDTPIFRQAELPIVTSNHFHSLFSMLEMKRFDYFPRSVTEILVEAAQYPDLVIEKKLLLSYSTPVYFFVKPQNDQLAEVLTRGVSVLKREGQIDALLEETFKLKELYLKLDMSERRILKIP